VGVSDLSVEIKDGFPPMPLPKYYGTLRCKVEGNVREVPNR
jgi:hypothetical protein